MDATVAYRRACLNTIEYLKTFGYTGEQAYLLLGSAPIEGRSAGSWTSQTHAARSTCRRRSSFDIPPTKDGPASANRGTPAATSDVPVYVFTCEACGPFELWRPVVDAAAALGCPTCGLAPGGASPPGRLPRAGAIARGP
jgi:hypothetical protein